MAEKKKIPAPSKYNSWIKPKILGNYKQKETKQTVIDSIAFEKAYVPAPNKYNPVKSLAEESKLRNIPRTVKTTRSLKEKEKPTPAPGAKMTDESLNFLLKKITYVKFDKTKGMSFINQTEKRAKVIPGVGTYKTTESTKVLAPMPFSLRRKR